MKHVGMLLVAILINFGFGQTYAYAELQSISLTDIGTTIVTLLTEERTISVDSEDDVSEFLNLGKSFRKMTTELGYEHNRDVNSRLWLLNNLGDMGYQVVGINEQEVPSDFMIVETYLLMKEIK